MIYMFRLESWNITPSQYREWGADLSVDGDGGFIVTFFGREFDFLNFWDKLGKIKSLTKFCQSYPV